MHFGKRVSRRLNAWEVGENPTLTRSGNWGRTQHHATGFGWEGADSRTIQKPEDRFSRILLVSLRAFAYGLLGYGYNYVYLSPMHPPTYTPIAVSLSAIHSVAETAWIADSAQWRTWGQGAPAFEGTGFLEPPSYNNPTFHGRHNGMGNVLWCDGHAKAFKPALRTETQYEPHRQRNLGAIDRDGNPQTDELMDLQ